MKSGFFCLYFPITDPGSSHAPVGVTKRDWMANCEKAGLDLSYVAREEIMVDGEMEWADHYSCHFEYKEVN